MQTLQVSRMHARDDSTAPAELAVVRRSIDSGPAPWLDAVGER